MKKEVIIIKLGGSVITDKSKPLHHRKKYIDTLVAEIGAIAKAYPDCHLIIGNGAGSYGHYTVGSTNYKQDTRSGLAISKVHQSVVALNSIIVEALQRKNIPAISLQPSLFFYGHTAQKLNNTQHAVNYLQTVFRLNMIPVFYGDIAFDGTDDSFVLSTERIISYLAKETRDMGLSIKAIVFATDVDGVLDTEGTLINDMSDSCLRQFTSKASTKFVYDVTGGMRHKVQTCKDLKNFTDNVAIVNGTIKGRLLNAITKQATGTYF